MHYVRTNQLAHLSLLLDRYIDRLVSVSNGESTAPINAQVMNWMEKIDGWDPKIFTLSHIPKKYNRFVTKFIRRVIISRMADSPDLASAYHAKLRTIYDTEERLMNQDFLQQSVEKLNALLNDVEVQLNETTYLSGEDFTMADCMFLPILARLSLLNLEDEYINCRPKISEYYNTVKQRQSYKLVICRYFLGWKKYTTLLKTSFFLAVRTILKRY